MAHKLTAALLFCALAFGTPTPQDADDLAIKSDDATADNTAQSTQPAYMAPDPGQNYGGSAASSYDSPAFLPIDKLYQGLYPQVSQNQSNGYSVLGTWRAPKLGPWVNLGGEPMPQGFPWGSRTCKDTDPYDDPPETGVTRYYDFTITKKTIWPDGVQKDGLVVNDAFPGPTIEANWGDWIQVKVHNKLTEGTALHWHGLLQKDTPYMDDVPGITQCPIAPGKTFTYRFKANLYGSSWWHSHYSSQYADGLFGAMIIHGPSDNAKYDVDLGPVLLTDLYHTKYYDILQNTLMAPASKGLPPPFSNNNPINGKNNYPCASLNGTRPCIPNAGVSKFNFTSGKTYRLRLINAGTEGIQKFSIDNHQMTVIANDYVPVVPYDIDVVTLAVGQRSDIIVKAKGAPTDAVWMRSTLGLNAFRGGCTLIDGISPLAVAAIYYENANQSSVPTTTSTVSMSRIVDCNNDPLASTKPYYTYIPEAPTTVQTINMTYTTNGTHNLFFMDNSSFRTNYNDPVYLEAKLGNLKYAPKRNVYNFGSNSSIRIVLYNYAFTGAHPMHMHGHNFYILAQGFGQWNGTVQNSNPQRRDTHIIASATRSGTPAYLVVQIDADNPGTWPMHCHVAWHASQGFSFTILERPKDIKKVSIPQTVVQTCRDWSDWTGQNVVEQIDSGL